MQEFVPVSYGFLVRRIHESPDPVFQPDFNISGRRCSHCHTSRGKRPNKALWVAQYSMAEKNIICSVESNALCMDASRDRCGGKNTFYQKHQVRSENTMWRFVDSVDLQMGLAMIS